MINIKLIKAFNDFKIDVVTEFIGGINVIAGTSGSGKSTLLKMITGFVKPDEGYIHIQNKYVFDSKRKINTNPEKRKIGYVPQNYLLFPHMNVFGNVSFGLIESKESNQNITSKVEEMLELCNIMHLIHRFPSELSGGEKQRVALARSMVLQPSLLLMDEPFSALDIHTRKFIRSEIRDILKSTSIPTIMVTHDPMDALSFGERLYIMEKGQVIQTGTIEEIKSHPKSRFAAEFTGLNGYYGIATNNRNGMVQVKLQNGFTLTTVGDMAGEVLVLIDPTDIMLSRNIQENFSRNSFRASVKELINESHGQWRLALQGDLNIIAQISSETIEKFQIAIGDHIHASIKATAIKLEKV